MIKSLAQLGNQAALEELVRTRSDHLDVLPLLKTYVRSTRVRTIQNSIIQALARYWKDDPETLFLVQELAQSGNSAAIVELASTWRYEPYTLSILKTLARSGNSSAVVELVLGWGSDPNICILIHQVIESQNTSPSIANGDLLREIHFDYETHFEILKVALTRFGDEGMKELLEWKFSRTKYTCIEDIEYALQQLRELRQERVESWFSTLRTKITDSSVLVKTLRSLGFMVKTQADIRGHNGQRVRVDVVAVLEGGYDLGWSRNPDGTFDLIADLRGVAQKHNQTELINSINQRFSALIKGYKRFSN